VWRHIDILRDLLQQGEHCALATVIRASGSSPQQIGAKLLVSSGGEWSGTVGGGRIEHEVRSALAECLINRKNRVLSFDLVRDLGMCCGGTMEVYVESIELPPRALLFGAGHVAKATAAALLPLNFRLEIIDERED